MRITGNEGRLERENLLFKFQMAIFHRGVTAQGTDRAIALFFLPPFRSFAFVASLVSCFSLPPPPPPSICGRVNCAVVRTHFPECVRVVVLVSV